MFPTANSVIYRNADGEITDWDTITDDAPEPDDFDSYEAEEDDTPFMTEDYDFDNELSAQEDMDFCNDW